MAGKSVDQASTADLKAVHTKLEALYAEADWIYDFLHQPGKSAIQNAEWTDRARALKDKLESEHKRMDTIAGQSALNIAERSFYQGTIHSAWVNMRITRGAAPSPKWNDAAYKVRSDLRHMIYQLKDVLTERGPG